MQNELELKTDVGRRLLQHALTEHEMSQLIGRSRLDVLDGLSAELLASLLKEELPQTQAIILAHIDARKSFETLEELPAKMRSQVLSRIAKLEPVLPSVLDELNVSLKEKVQKLDRPVG